MHKKWCCTDFTFYYNPAGQKSSKNDSLGLVGDIAPSDTSPLQEESLSLRLIPKPPLEHPSPIMMPIIQTDTWADSKSQFGLSWSPLLHLYISKGRPMPRSNLLCCFMDIPLPCVRRMLTWRWSWHRGKQTGRWGKALFTSPEPLTPGSTFGLLVMCVRKFPFLLQSVWVWFYVTCNWNNLD